ncbi:MAG: HlyD family efflux transporter periplasmic adaptor subunit [Parachlamydiales bacterium]|nr:HlyD family efflux transporter periplasmic adaptor subunit [Parachlamydiales bacterium]
MSENLFRKNSYEKLGSPEELDQLLVIVPPKGWIALITLIAMIVALLFWSAFATIPIQTTALGVVNTPSGFYTVRSFTNGIIEKVSVSKGNYVDIDTPLITLYSQQNEGRLENAKNQVQLLQGQVELLKKQLAADQQLDEYIITQLQKLASEDLTLQSNQDNLFHVLVSVQEMLSTLLRELTTDRMNQSLQFLNEASLTLNALEQESKQLALKAPVEGEVINVAVNTGQYVSAGTPLATISQPLKENENYEIYGYVPLEMRGLILPGMEAQIHIVDLKDHQNETIYGRVVDIDQYAESPADIHKNFISEKVYRHFFGQAPLLQVRIIPLYSKDGLGQIGHFPTLFPGEICSMRITLDRKTPFKYLIP